MYMYICYFHKEAQGKMSVILVACYINKVTE